MEYDVRKISLYLLAGLTVLDLLLWFISQQTALFLAIILLIPLWALWVWKFVPPGEEEEHRE